MLSFPSAAVREIDFANNTDHPQLQIADWVAGISKDVAMVQWYGKDAAYPPKAIALAESWLASGPLAVDQELIANLGS